MTTLCIEVYAIVGRAESLIDSAELLIYNHICDDCSDDPPTLEFRVGRIREEVLEFQLTGYDEISMLKAFCEQVLQAHDRHNLQ